MPPVWKVVTMENHAFDLLLWEATPVDPILTQLVQEGFLPEIVPDVIEEFFLLKR